MSRITKALLITAVAVMLVGATSASAYYYERWNGWFNSGYLTYDDYTYTFVAGDNLVDDYTDGRQDRFCLSCIAYTSFACVETDDTIEVSVSTFTGSKPTGQEDQKEGSGDWAGTAVLKGPFASPVNFDIEGTWASTGNHFNYDTEPYPTYTAEWRISNSDPLGLTGTGTSAGELLE